MRLARRLLPPAFLRTRMTCARSADRRLSSDGPVSAAGGVRRPSARSSGRIVRPRDSTTARVNVFSSSRTLPGQSYAVSRASAGGESERGSCASHARAAKDMVGEELDVTAPLAQRRHDDLHDAQPEVEILAKSPARAATARVADASPPRHERPCARTRSAPTGWNSCSCSTRSSFVWNAGLVSPISSRNTVPRPASGETPASDRSRRAGERALHVTEQLRSRAAAPGSTCSSPRRTARRASSELKWIARAITSFPVPVSPRIKHRCPRARHRADRLVDVDHRRIAPDDLPERTAPRPPTRVRSRRRCRDPGRCARSPARSDRGRAASRDSRMRRPASRHSRAHVLERRHHDNVKIGMRRVMSREQLEPVHPAHAHVRDDERRVDRWIRESASSALADTMTS